MKRYSLIITTLLCCICFTNITAQNTEPNTNLRISLFQLKQKFPNLQYVKSDLKGNLYRDGKATDDVIMYFYAKENKVVEESMVIQTNDGYSKMMYDETVKAFTNKGGFITADFGENHVKLSYSFFDIDFTYQTSNGLNTMWMIYSLNGWGRL